MNLQEMSTKDLLALHNRIADKAAGPKTFATRGKLLDRIESIAKAKNIDGATLAYVQLTVNCVNCHKYVRESTK